MHYRLTRPPVIHLEVSPPGEVPYTICLLILSIVIFNIYMATIPAWALVTYFQPNTMCSVNQTYGSFNYGESCILNDTVWKGHFEDWRPYSGLFTLTLQMNSPNVSDLSFGLNYTLDVFAERRHHHNIIFYRGYNFSTNISCSNYVCPSLDIFPDNFLDCESCPGLLSDYKTWWTRLTYHSLSTPETVSNLNYNYHYDAFGQEFAMTNLCLHIILGIMIIIWLIFWVYHAVSRTSYSFNDWLFERKIVCIMLLMAIFATVSPFYYAILRGGSSALRVINTFFIDLCLGVTWVLWLVILASLRQEKRNSIPLKFYLGKAIYLMVYAVLLLLRVATESLIYVKTPDPSWVWSLYLVQQILIIAWAAGIILYFGKTAWGTYKHLQQLPYLRTRYRQLSFRYISLIMVFNAANLFIAYSISGYFKSQSRLTSFYSGFSSGGVAVTFVHALCIILTSYMYLPPEEDFSGESGALVKTAEISYGSPVSLHTASCLIGFASHAYRDPPETVDSKKGELRPDYFGFTYLKFLENKETDTHVLLAQQYGHTIISFRGTDSLKNMMTDIKIRLLHYCGHSNCRKSGQLACEIKTKVHSGFLTAYLSIVDDLMEALEEFNIPKADVFLTGHSLGGALATLAALEMSLLGYNVTLYSFGSPRVGCQDFAQFYNNHVPNTFRFVNDGDPVAGFPKLSFLKVFQNKFKHVGIGVFCDRFGDIIIQPTEIERFLKTGGVMPIKHLTASYRTAINACIGRIHAEQNAKHKSDGNEEEGIRDSLRQITYSMLLLTLGPSQLNKDDIGIVKELNELQEENNHLPLASRLTRTISHRGPALRTVQTLNQTCSGSYRSMKHFSADRASESENVPLGEEASSTKMNTMRKRKSSVFSSRNGIDDGLIDVTTQNNLIKGKSTQW